MSSSTKKNSNDENISRDSLCSNFSQYSAGSLLNENDSAYLQNQRSEASKLLQARQSIRSAQAFKNVRKPSDLSTPSKNSDCFNFHTPTNPGSNIPSKFLRPNDFTPLPKKSAHSVESTINESDLFKSNLGSNNSSTPRQTLSSNTSNTFNQVDLADSLRRLSYQIQDPNISFSSALKKLNQEYEKISASSSQSISSDMFVPAENFEGKLIEDEASWRREKDLPVSKDEFSVRTNNDKEMSIGNFFKQRSENVSDIIPAPMDSMINSVEVIDKSLDIENYFKNFSESKLNLPSSNTVSISSLDMIPSSSKNIEISGASDLITELDSRSEDLKITENEESLTATKLNNLIASIDGTPGKLFDNFMKKCQNKTKKPKSQKLTYGNSNSDKENVEKNTSDDDFKSELVKSLAKLDISKNSVVLSNYNPRNIENQDIPLSIASSRSSSVLSNLPGGKLPIHTNHSELIWGCVKPGKSSIKQFLIKNCTSNKFRFQCSISSPFFKFVNDSESSNHMKYTFHGNESKTILVSFNPISDGFVCDEIVFNSIEADLQQTRRQTIRLYGYGGTCNLVFKKNVTRDISGQYFVSLGCVDDEETLYQTFEIVNQGSLPSFFLMEYTPKNHLYYLDLITKPIKWVLQPGETKLITLEYKQTKGDVTYIQSLKKTVNYIGSLKIISGPDVLRHRIRNLFKLAKQKNIVIDDICEILSSYFPGENDETEFKSKRTEFFSNIKTLLQILNIEDVNISLEHDLDKTMMPISHEDSTMLQSLCEENTIIENTNMQSKIKLEPSLIILNPPNKCGDLLFISSGADRPLHFNFNVPDCFKFEPHEGTINPSETKIIKINMSKLDTKSAQTVSVHIDGFMFYVNIKILLT